MLGTRGVWLDVPRGSGTGFLIISILGHLSVPGLPDSDSDSDARYSITERSQCKAQLATLTRIEIHIFEMLALRNI